MNPILHAILNKSTDAQVYLSELIVNFLHTCTVDDVLQVDVVFVDNTMSIIINDLTDTSECFNNRHDMINYLLKCKLNSHLNDIRLMHYDFIESITYTRSTSPSNRHGTVYVLTILQT